MESILGFMEMILGFILGATIIVGVLVWSVRHPSPWRSYRTDRQPTGAQYPTFVSLTGAI